MATIMAVSLLFFSGVLTVVFSLAQSTLLPPRIDVQTSYEDQANNGIVSELQQMKIKIARLENVLEESIKNINAKSLYLDDHEKLINEMGQKIRDLQSALLEIKRDSSHSEERLNALEEEVRLLWAASRKNNFDIHVLESKAQANEEKLEVIRSQVQKMNDIVTEHWIQLRHLEQALQGMEMRVLKAQRIIESKEYTLTMTFLNMGNYLQKMFRTFGTYLFGNWPTCGSSQSQTLHQLKRFFSAAKNYHHQLQSIIKRHMERYEITADLANEEVVFFVVSALITFPIISAWMFLSSQFY